MLLLIEKVSCGPEEGVVNRGAVVTLGLVSDHRLRHMVCRYKTQQIEREKNLRDLPGPTRAPFHCDQEHFLGTRVGAKASPQLKGRERYDSFLFFGRPRNQDRHKKHVPSNNSLKNSRGCQLDEMRTDSKQQVDDTKSHPAHRKVPLVAILCSYFIPQST